MVSGVAPMPPPLAQKVNWDFPVGKVMVCLAMNCTGPDAMTADQSQCECSRMPNVVWRTGVQLSVCVLFRSEPFNKANNTLQILLHFGGFFVLRPPISCQITRKAGCG